MATQSRMSQKSDTSIELTNMTVVPSRHDPGDGVAAPTLRPVEEGAQGAAGKPTSPDEPSGVNDVCYLCGSSRSRDVFVEDGVALRRCLGCGHVYSSWKQVDHHDGYWDGGITAEDIPFWDDAHRPVYRQFLDRFVPAEPGTLVDVGCGLGFFVQAARRARPAWAVHGYEQSGVAVEWAHRHNHLEGVVHQGRVEDAGIEPGSVDVVTMWDVIEHIPRPQELLVHLRGLLKPRGFLYLQTPNWPFQYLRARAAVMADRGAVPGKMYLAAKDHVNQFSKDSLTRLALDTGFDPPRFEILQPVMTVGGKQSWVGVLAKVGIYQASRVVWQGSGGRVLVNPSLFAFLTAT